MKRWFLLGLLLFVPRLHAQTQIQGFAADPVTCDPSRGLLYYNTVSQTFKSCTAVNAWSAFGAAGIGGTIANTQVAFGTAVNTVGGSGNFTWNNAAEMLLVGDPTSGLNAGTSLPLGTWSFQGIHHNTSTTPQDAGVLGVVQADNGVDSTTNSVAGGYFSASALTNLNSTACCGTLTGVQGVGTALHSTGNNGQVLGGLFTGTSAGAGTVSDLAGMAAQSFVTGSGLVGSAAAIRVYSAVVSGGTPPTGLYGIKLNSIIGGVTNWAIFSGTGKVEFGDNEIVHGTITSNGSITGAGAIPGTPGLTAIPIQSGLLAEYRMLPSETAAALVDYSGNGNNATGTVGTAPTIIAGSGGVLFGGAGAISLPSALNSALSVQIFFVPGAGNGGAVLAGNGVTANLLLLTPTRVTGTNDSILSGYSSEHNLRILTGRVDTAPFAGLGSYPRAIVPSGGAANIIWTMNGAAADLVYFNGVATNSYITQGNATGNAHQASGNYQLGGLASASCTNWSAQLCNYMANGSQIYYAVFYNRIITATEAQQNTAYINSYVSHNGITLSPYKIIDASSAQFLTIGVDGDSLSCGPCASVTPLPAGPYTSYLFGLTGPTGSNSTTNQALGGRNLVANMVPGGSQAIDPLYYPYSAGNLTICAFCGTNDSTLGQYQGGLVEWSLDRRKVGWKTLVAGVLDGKGDSIKNTYNAWLRQNWRSFADGFVDVAATTQLGANGANSNTTDFYTTDNLHIQDNGIINYEAPYIKRAINRLYGNHDFTSATVYASAAAAAVATTAGTSSATQNVITTAATPANCVAGDWVTVAGVTPAGYNGNFYIIASTGTTVTVHNAPSQSSLAAISVQGNIVCPQQQDADEYQIVNFGAGNYSLQTCVALTGQNIYIQNINAGATTLLPFASETITGAGATPTTLAANTTAILQSVLVSAAAGGCNWVRSQ